MDDEHLLELAIRTRYTLDPRQRLVRENEPDGDRAPRCFVGRTCEAVWWWARDDVPDEVYWRLKPVLALERFGDDLPPEPRGAPDIIADLEHQAPVERIWSGPSLVFPDHMPAPRDMFLITSDQAALLADTFPGLYRTLAARRPCVAVVRDGAAVSICYSARNSSEAAEAGVDTLAAYRGRGYAVAVTAAWAALVRQEGRLPLYSTSWDNAASLGVARRLGLRRFSYDYHVR